MTSITSYFIYSYLLLPLLGLLFLILGIIIAKKTKLLKNKKMVIYFLAAAIILALPGLLGFIDYWFMPYVYIGLIVFYILCGCWNIRLLYSIEPKFKEDFAYYAEFLFNLFLMFLSLALFSLLFNLMNELKYGIWAATCVIAFILPSLFYKTYISYIEIPIEIYSVWKYDKDLDLSQFDSMDYNKLHVMELELFKNVNDPIPSKIKAKAPDNLVFGVWFQKFITDYNVKFPSTPIAVDNQTYKTDTDFDLDSSFNFEIYTWIFYVKPSFFLPRRRIDFTKTIKENRLNEKYTIIAKRVSEDVTELYKSAEL